MKKKNDIALNMKKIELMFCVLVFIVFLILLFNAFKSFVFIPASLIMGALDCVSIGYSLRHDEDKSYYVYGLFIVGVILLIVSIFYTFVKMV